MIPVLILPVYNRGDLVERAVASIDVPVDRLVIVDNSPEALAWHHPGPESACGDRPTIFRPPFRSMGYTGSINYVIGQTTDAPWWVWTSNDVVFGPGDLEAIAGMMESAHGPRIVTHGFMWGALNAACVEAVGLFDEWSFWPIYFDDNDYLVRCIAGDVDWLLYSGKIEHGADGHASSLTIKSDEHAALANARSWAENKAAYIDKWGGEPGAEVYSLPWNRLPLWATRPSPIGREARSWSSPDAVPAGVE